MQGRCADCSCPTECSGSMKMVSENSVMCMAGDALNCHYKKLDFNLDGEKVFLCKCSTDCTANPSSRAAS